MADQKEKCFIITPIGDENDPIRRHIDGIIEACISPALSEQFEIVVAHKMSEPGTITKQIISEIVNDKLVIANLTNRNPNVMYELALRHTLGLPVIMIAEKGTQLPFDVIMERTIPYTNDAKGVLELKEAIIEAEKKIEYGQKYSPIYDIIGDLSTDIDMINQVKNKTGDEEADSFKYILKRLDKIESCISQKQEKSSLGIRSHRRCYLTIAYNSFNGEFEPEKIGAFLSDKCNGTYKCGYVKLGINLAETIPNRIVLRATISTSEDGFIEFSEDAIDSVMRQLILLGFDELHLESIRYVS